MPYQNNQLNLIIMKKLLIIKTILLIVALCLISLFASCSPQEPPIPQEQTKILDVTILGNSPEFWYHNAKDNTTIKYTQSHIVLEVHNGDTINAIGYGYTIDNSNNYNAPNVFIIGLITFKINDVVVANGVDTLAYQIK